jgi:hypothetical protein
VKYPGGIATLKGYLGLREDEPLPGAGEKEPDQQEPHRRRRREERTRREMRKFVRDGLALPQAGFNRQYCVMCGKVGDGTGWGDLGGELWVCSKLCDEVLWKFARMWVNPRWKARNQQSIYLRCCLFALDREQIVIAPGRKRVRFHWPHEEAVGPYDFPSEFDRLKSQATPRLPDLDWYDRHAR